MRHSHWGELVWAADHDTAVLSRAAQRGTLLRLGTGLYTGAVDDGPAEVVSRNLWPILAHELPGAVIVDRSARAGGQPVGGELLVAHSRRHPLELPGLTIVPRPGPGPLEQDMSLPGGISLASEARTMLESLARPGGRRLGRHEVEAWIDDLSAHGGEERVNALRDLARRIAPDLRALTAFAVLQRLAAAALSTGDARDVTSRRLAARAVRRPYDHVRLERFRALTEYLLSIGPGGVLDLPVDAARRAVLPFYEAYFSNYIEGTEFTLDEAARIVFDGEMPAARPEDAHDVLGTYAVVADPILMREIPDSGSAFVDVVRRRHAQVMAGRSRVRPGEFKLVANRAGNTEFVPPEMVEGSLLAAYDVAAPLLDPFQRSVYVMFVVAEVHPFMDGNGRVARICMNAELVGSAQVRIIIPTVFRLNYVSALKAGTHSNAFAPLVAVLDFTQRYTARIDFTSRATAEADLQRSHALRDPYEAEQAGIRLQLP